MDLSRFYFVNPPIDHFLDAKSVSFLNENKVQKLYSKGEDIFLEGTLPKGVYLLNAGKVKLYQKSHDGSQQIMNIHVPGELFGYRPLLCDDQYPVGATAIEDCKISFVRKKDFFALLKQSTALSNGLLRFLSHEFTVWVNTVSNLSQRSVKERLLLNLLILIDKYQVKAKWPVEITLSRADLAGLIGTSNETLARILKQIREEKCITTKGRTIVVNGPQQVLHLRATLLRLWPIS